MEGSLLPWAPQPLPVSTDGHRVAFFLRYLTPQEEPKSSETARSVALCGTRPLCGFLPASRGSVFSHLCGPGVSPAARLT